MELKNIHRGSDAYMVLSLTNDGVRMDFSTMEDIVVATYADSQKAFAGKCEILSIEGTAMRVKSPAKAQRFVGAQRLVLTCTYDGRTASYDAPAFNVVATSAEVDSQGMTAEQENADIGIDLKVEEVTSSLVQEIVSAAVKATDEAHSASLAALAQAERAGVSADDADKSSALAQQKAALAATKASDAEAAATRANEAVATINGKFAEQDKFISDTINEQNEQIQTKFAEQDKHVAKKAEVDGRYPEMSVGFADDLVGRGESVPAEFSFRASGGKSIKDGAARIKRLKGNSVVWNQQVQHESRTEGSCSSAWDGDVITINGVSPQGYYSIMRNKIPCALNEKFLIIAEEVANPNNLSFSVGLLNAVQDRATLGGGNTFSAVIGNSITTIGSGFGIDKFGGEGTDLTGIRFKVRVINLTQMFQAGNEPTTIEEFNARKPIVEDEYAYNEGEVIHMTAEGIKSVGDNAWDEEWGIGRLNTDTGQVNTGNNGIYSKNYIKVLPNETYYCGYNAAPIFAMFYDAEYNLILQVSGSNNFINIRNRQFTTPANAVYMRFYVADNNITTYNNDIMITLVHSGWKQDTDAGYQPYWEDRFMFDKRIKDEFPNGMPKWDMVYNKNGKGYIVKGTYGVKIKDLNIRRDAEGVFIAQPIPAVANTDSKGWSAEIVSARFIGDGTAYDYDLSPYNSAFIVENSLWMNGQSLASYLTKEDFIRDYGDDMLYYQLAEPVVIEYDEPFNLDYRVADFGTEQAIAETNSAPISADIIYQFNAVDMIREHEIEIAELQSIIATMQAQLVSLTNKE